MEYSRRHSSRCMDEDTRIWRENMEAVQRIAKFRDVGTSPEVPLGASCWRYCRDGWICYSPGIMR